MEQISRNEGDNTFEYIFSYIVGPPISAGSIPADSTNCELKILEGGSYTVADSY